MVLCVGKGMGETLIIVAIDEEDNGQCSHILWCNSDKYFLSDKNVD